MTNIATSIVTITKPAKASANAFLTLFSFVEKDFSIFPSLGIKIF